MCFENENFYDFKSPNFIMDDETDGGFVPDNNIEKNIEISHEDCLALPISSNECCSFCNAIPVIYEIKAIFSILVCNSCSKTELKFITKTHCRTNYLLTEEELKEFKYLTRPNPRKTTWNDMQLYLETQIHDFSTNKYGSIDQIEILKQERNEKRKELKVEKIKKKVKELKRKTFIAPRAEKHKHQFFRNKNKSQCKCGFEIEEEEI